MTIDPLFYALLFVGILIASQGLYFLIYDWRFGRNRQINRRLQMLAGGMDPVSVMRGLRKELAEKGILTKVPLVGSLIREAAHADLRLSPAMLVMIWLSFTIVFFLFFLTLSLSISKMLVFILSLLCSFFLLYLWIKTRVKNKLRQFEEQLPDAIDLVVRSLRIGHPLNSAIAMVASEMPDPIGSEFGLASDEVTYGMDLTDAISRMSERVPIQDMRFFAVAVSIQYQSGGNLAEVLEGLSAVVRSRFRMFRKIRAITAEARWSGRFLSLFPIAMFFIIPLVRPGYYDVVRGSPIFTPMAVLVIFLLAVNIFFMRALANIKV